MPPPRRIELPGSGPEDVVVDADGCAYTGIADGRILRITPDRRVERVARLAGRALGMGLLPDGRLLACNTGLGVQRIDCASGEVTTLVDSVHGRPMVFCSNVVATRDGTIYFTESSRRFPLEDYRSDLIEHSCTGSLMRRNVDGSVDVLLEGMLFANGLRLADDESHLVVAETAGYRLRRYWLSGARAGQDEVLIDNLPGFPDNIGWGSDGTTWVALPSPRDPVLDRLLPRADWLRKAAWTLPEWLQPQPKRTAWVLQVDADGRVLRDLQRSGDTYHFVTGCCEHDGRLYMSSLAGSAIAVIDL